MLLLGGTLTMEDLKSFKVRVEVAWTVPLGDTQMHIPPPPAGGAILAFILKLMKGFMGCVMTVLWYLELTVSSLPFILNQAEINTQKIAEF